MKLSLKKGFTLVELLVVMAIISLLAAIVIPNVINFIRQGRATRARADISGLESALVKILSDSGRGNLGQLFNPDKVREALGLQPGDLLTAETFKRAQQLYSAAVYVILRDGRAAVGQTILEGLPLGPVNNEPGLLNAGVVAKLSSSYVELGFDPWGNLYNIYPGPWPQGNGAIPFRKLFPESATSANGVALPGAGDRADALTAKAEDPDNPGSFLEVSYPAPRDKVAFIWSNGENLASGTAIYNPAGYVSNDPDRLDVIPNYFDLAGNGDDPLLAAGGDDVNNWDNGSSWTRFY